MKNKGIGNQSLQVEGQLWYEKKNPRQQTGIFLISEAMLQPSLSLRFFQHRAQVSTNGFHFFHPFLDGWFREERPFLEFL